VRPVALIAVALSGVLGVALGITGGLALDREQPEAAAFVDPLRLGVPNRNQPVCTNQALLSVSRGSGESKLASVVGKYRDQHIAYLDTTKSCPAAWVPAELPTPRYVLYLRPFETSADACDAKFSAGDRGGIVTRLNAGTTDPVACLCFVTLARPILKPAISTEGGNGIWVRQLQQLLVDMGRAPAGDADGSYDNTTATRIRAFQRDHGLSATGVVDADTWDALLRQGCDVYDS
jgi:hypothetical protein